jgi:hypothetical protein
MTLKEKRLGLDALASVASLVSVGIAFCAPSSPLVMGVAAGVVLIALIARVYANRFANQGRELRNPQNHCNQTT